MWSRKCVLTFISIQEVHTLAPVGTRVANTPNSCCAGLARVVLWTGAREVIEGDGAAPFVFTWLNLKKNVGFNP